MTKRSENDQTSDLKPFLQKWFSNVLFDQPARTKRGTILKPDLQFDFNDKYYEPISVGLNTNSSF